MGEFELKGLADDPAEASYAGAAAASMNSPQGYARESVRLKEGITEFMKGAAEMTVELGKGCRDIVKQSLVNEDSYLVRNFGSNSYIGKRIRGPTQRFFGKLSFFNKYLPEDKDPLHVWSVIFSISLLAFAGKVRNFHFPLLFGVWGCRERHEDCSATW